MGQAKRRGSFETRKAEAQAKAEERRAEQARRLEEDKRRIAEFEIAHPAIAKERAQHRHNRAMIAAVALGLAQSSGDLSRR